MAPIQFYCDLDSLNRQYWRFYYDDRDHTLYVDEFAIEKRESIRHRFKPIFVYHRLDTRANTLLEDQIPLRHEVIDKAQKEFGLPRVALWQKRA